jgi:hypothetical protein
MRLTNPLPDDSSSSITLPSVEWMPLDGLVVQWTAALSALEWPRAEALQASSAALHALALETTARHSYLSVETVRTWTPPTPELVGQHLGQAFLDLVEAHRHWQAVGEWLERLSRECRREERTCYPLLCELFTTLATHQGYLCQLLARLATELVPVPEQVQQARTQTLAQAFGVAAQEERP